MILGWVDCNDGERRGAQPAAAPTQRNREKTAGRGLLFPRWKSPGNRTLASFSPCAELVLAQSHHGTRCLAENLGDFLAAELEDPS